MKRTATLALILAAILIAAKLSGLIAWSWWIVTFPLWIFPAIGSLIMLVGICVVAWAVRNQ